MVFYIGGMTGGMVNEISTAVDQTAAAGGGLSVAQAMSELGLTISASGYLLFGLQLFLTIAIGLAIALILGAMATDIKSVQTLTLPIMAAVMLPWIITMFTDVNGMSAGARLLVYLIPFTSAYMAIPNLMSGNTLVFAAGIVYQTLFLLVCMYLAVKMFTTDKLFTLSFNPDASKKKKGRGKKTAEAEADA
jgi:ABC-2 type transport system permease protein